MDLSIISLSQCGRNKKTFGWREQVKQNRFESANGHMTVKS